MCPTEVYLRQPALLALEDGTVFYGESIGIAGQTVGEVVFNTAMTGYQEILTDPSYARQIVTLTYPHIGNVGTNDDDEESSHVYASGLVVRDVPAIASNWRKQETLPDYLVRNKVVAIAGLDTRKLTRVLREKGAQNGCIMAGDKLDEQAAIAAAKEFPGLKGMDLAKEVTTGQPYEWAQGTWSLEGGMPTAPHPVDEKLPYHVVAYDFGIKRNILRMLVDRGCRLTVVPAQTPASEVLKLAPDGVFLSNGPGDPEPCDYAIEAIQQLADTARPMFGICLGHQLLGLALGGQTYKLKFGHRGANQPVKNIKTGRIEITSQNHGFCVDLDTLNTKDIEITHINLNDNTLEGFRHLKLPLFAVQYHPEASPGPHDARYLFKEFRQLIQTNVGV